MFRIATLQMIRRGKDEGWLSLPPSSLRPWADLQGVTFNGVEIGTLPESEAKGSALLATTSSLDTVASPLLIVPRDIILSKDNIELYAKSDTHLRKILDATGSFGTV